LEAAAQRDSAHVLPGSRGPHVGKIQQALMDLDGAKLARDDSYGPATAAAVLAYKQKRNIINSAYQTKADNIVGKMTVASLDREMFARENGPSPLPPGPLPPQPPGPGPHPSLNFAMTDPSIYVSVEGPVTQRTAPTRKAIDPATFLKVGKMGWMDLAPVSGKTALLKVEKKGSIFWVILFVPDGTVVSHMLHIFFHPTPVQVFPDKPGQPPVAHIIADDKTYDGFGKDWKALGQRYLGVIGPQLGAARKIALLIPMMRNAAAQGSNASNDVFADRPLDTLYEILTVARDKVINPPADAPALPLSMQHVNIGTSSFSSGIAYHANLYNRIKSHGSYLEAIDLDSTYIRTQHLDLSPQTGGPTIKRHSQSEGPPSTANHLQFPPSRWDGKAANAPVGTEKVDTPPTTNRVHHLIAEYTFFGAMQNSLLKP
jgi:peptidoglycan hydrolase-like protein with peptidoglycan-binding domain